MMVQPEDCKDVFMLNGSTLYFRDTKDQESVDEAIEFLYEITKINRNTYDNNSSGLEEESNSI